MAYETVELKNGETLYLEISRPSDTPVQAGLREVAKNAGISLSREIAKVGNFLTELRQGISDTLSEHPPNQIEFEIGLEFNQEFGCVLVKSAVNAQMKARITWNIEN